MVTSASPPISMAPTDDRERTRDLDFGLTPKQLETLRFVRAFQQEKGFTPTHQEIANHFGLDKVSVHERLAALERKGAIKRSRSRAVRRLELVDSPARRLAGVVMEKYAYDVKALRLAEEILGVGGRGGGRAP